MGTAAIESVGLIAIAGNPNSGKTTLFNALTGLRQKVGNYPGVTVERREGWARAADGQMLRILDLPGTYSIAARSPEEQIARGALLGLSGDERPERILVVVDASNLIRNLYLCTQLMELGLPLIVALNMVDVAAASGYATDPEALARALGVPVIAIVARDGTGLDLLLVALAGPPPQPPKRPLQFSDDAEARRLDLAAALSGEGRAETLAALEAEALLFAPEERLAIERAQLSPPIAARIDEHRRALGAAGADLVALPIEARYRWIHELAARVQSASDVTRESASERVDRILTHPILGPLAFLLCTAILFQIVFTLSAPLSDAIDGLCNVLAELCKTNLGEGLLSSLLADGAVKGVGAVLVFLPQILCLFLFLSLLEDCGYMARAAFIMDRIMNRFGLSGRAFIPIMSAYGCAVPAIMATRTIESVRDRLVTILVLPFTTCSARLPVYVLLIALVIPERSLGFGLELRGFVMLSLYVLGILGVLAVALTLKWTILPAAGNRLLLELPAYKLPSPKAVAIQVADRAWGFIARAGTTILAASIVIWALSTFPALAPELRAAFGARRAAIKAKLIGTEATAALKAVDDEEGSERLRQSYAGSIGRGIEPFVQPLGFDWKISIGLLGSFLAREVFVSTMGVVYGVSGDSEDSSGLSAAMARDRGPDGRPLYSLPVVLSLLVFYVFACQCVSTLAICRRETNSWRWPLFMLLSMSAMAWLGAFATYRIALACCS